MSKVIHVETVEGLFLGRFHSFRVHTLLRVFVFCTAKEAERDSWLEALNAARVPQVPNESSLPSRTTGDVRSTRKVVDVMDESGKLVLSDSTRARRWRPKTRLVLNDRVLLEENTVAPLHVAGDLLSKVLAVKSELSDEEHISLINAMCMLKAVRFQGTTEQERLAFWLNVYHCLLLYGRLLLGVPKSKKELARFYSRVSYIVGLRPHSLREIERHILHVPKEDNRAVEAWSTGRAHTRQIISALCLCRRRALPLSPKAASSQPNTGSPPRSNPSSPKSPRTPQTAHTEVTVQRGADDGVSLGMCMPKVSLPQMPKSWKPRSGVPCLYLGHLNESFTCRLLKQDLRVILSLNRGSLSCLPDFPIFVASSLSEQLDYVCRCFMRQFVEVLKADENWSGHTQVTLPHCCRTMKRDMNLDPQQLLRFVWQFMPKETELPPAGTRINFMKDRPEPRPHADFRRDTGMDQCTKLSL